MLSYIQDKLGEYLQQRKEDRERQAFEQEQELAIETFFNQFSLLANNDYFRSQEPIFFLALEQANIFYDYSSFYRIKSCSILDYIKCEESRFSQFRMAKVKDESLVIEYNKEKRGKS